MNFYKKLCAAAVFALVTATGVASAETWRFGLEEIEGSVQAKYAEAFKELIEEKSGGDITVQLLPYGKWGSSYSELYDAIKGCYPDRLWLGCFGRHCTRESVAQPELRYAQRSA